MRKRYAEIDVDHSRCDGCGKCVAVCPENVLAVKNTVGRMRAVTVWSVKCIGCGNCLSVCNNKAIELETFRLTPSVA